MLALSEYLHITPEMLDKCISSLGILIFLTLLKLLASVILKSKVQNAKLIFKYRRISLYLYTIFLFLFIGPIWTVGISSLTTFLGLASAGIAIAMHDTIANIAGWIFIITRNPFKIGDRIQIGDTAGDVIDIRLFQFSLIEIGNWVDADQSTGRIVHVPNSRVLRESLANYHVGFEYIWTEIPVLVTFESDWRKTKKLLEEIVNQHAKHLSIDAQDQIRKSAEKFLIYYDKLTPIVYTTVKDSGVMLTIRYLVDPRARRTSEEKIWEAILDAFALDDSIDLAYPTTRYYTIPPPAKPTAPPAGKP
jgi:small-conductance mechanosensitive channel